jgi:hypothetical protein
MALVRVVSKNNLHNSWLVEPPKSPHNLIKDPFGYDGQPISVFEVAPGIEETKAVAAHYLTLRRNRFEAVWALRIEAHELDTLNIQLNRNTGDTGFADIDDKHCDLIGDKQKFEDLTKCLHNAIRIGEDRLKVVGPIQIKYQVEQFMLLKNDRINDVAKGQCQKILSRDQQ